MDTRSLLFASAILLITHLTYLSFTPPNAQPKKDPNDSIAWSSNPIFLQLRRSATIAIGIYHALLVLTISFPVTSSTTSSLLCPRPQNLNPTLFTWNLHTFTCITALLTFAPLRLISFANLGPNFTFRIAPPSKLITDGLYAYVQHPAYTANAVVIIANGFLLERSDCVAACWLSKEWVDALVWVTVGWGIFQGLGFMVVRVKDEERMLKKTFGREWEVWHARTKRFIPEIV